jgi:hypothetical protein
VPSAPETPPELVCSGEHAQVGFRAVEQLGGELPEGYREAVRTSQRRLAGV